MKHLSISLDIHSQNDNSALLEAELHGEPILFGLWDFDVWLRDTPLKAVGDWTEICTHKENGCEYHEIDLPLSHDFRLQRFFLLDHKDRLLILGDTVLGEETKRKQDIRYRSALYYSPKLRPKEPVGATEIEFRSAHSPFRVLPLALPEWKQQASAGLVSGSLQIENSAMLVLSQRSTGTSMFAPLFFDLNADRLGKRYTWRQLTVGENLQKVPDDQAVGYRVQLGKEQFLLYHSLTPMANRTVLGHNLIDDLCFARFDPATGVKPLIEVASNEW